MMCTCSNSESKTKRILIIRTDRIGDILLMTGAIELVRRGYPGAYIAMMVRPYAKDIVTGNPYLDEVILYDKDGKCKRIWENIGFIWALRKKRFDLCIILHPTNRVNIITFLAGIKKRVGYNRKCGFLLTKSLEDKRHLGEKHESEYSLDVLRAAGINPDALISKYGCPGLFMPIRSEDERKVEGFLKDNNVEERDRLIALHPSASCPSRIWPGERFAAVGDALIGCLGVKVVLVSSPHDVEIGEKVRERMHYPVVFACGKTTVGELASLLKRCKLLISNDSGPVHIAVAVGTPVISIFGRNERGLSPRRWKPLGERSLVLHKDVGCKECLAHDCKMGFKCLEAITVEEVLEGAEKLLMS